MWRLRTVPGTGQSLAADAKTPGWRQARPGVAALRSQELLAGRFIWQLVGVLDTYGSICLIGTKV